MANLKNIAIKIRIKIMYIVAVFLLILIPLLFFSFSSGLIEKIAKKIPLKEGTFDSKSGELKLTKPGR